MTPSPPPSPLPPPPAIGITVVRDRTPTGVPAGFMELRRLELAARYPDGTVSAPFLYDMTTRACIDAVVIAAHFERQGRLHVYLRSAIRPPCTLRAVPPAHDGLLWELPAGLIEPGEDPAACAARELGEELGFDVDPGALVPLGPWTFPAPGIIAERHLYYRVAVDPATRGTPTEDGSALERAAEILAVPLSDALEHCRSGAIRDAKTELALRRLAEVP